MVTPSFVNQNLAICVGFMHHFVLLWIVQPFCLVSSFTHIEQPNFYSFIFALCCWVFRAFSQLCVQVVTGVACNEKILEPPLNSNCPTLGSLAFPVTFSYDLLGRWVRPSYLPGT